MKHSYTEKELGPIASEVLSLLQSSDTGATVLALSGPLGAGKTSLVKELAQILEVPETVLSPTFVIAKHYTPQKGAFKSLVHMDAYRIESEDELTPLGFSELLKTPRTLVVIEWPERLPKTLSTIPISLFTLDHLGEARSIEGPLYHHEEKH